MTELWRLPWAGASRSPQDRIGLRPGPVVDVPATAWLCTPGAEPPSVDNRADFGCKVFAFNDGRHVWALPLPLRPSQPTRVSVPGGMAFLRFPHALERPSEPSGQDEEVQSPSAQLLARVKAVWARLREAETATADPARLWDSLHALWMNHGDTVPPMDVIVRQARQLKPVLDRLGQTRRRVLRRTQQMVPLARVQEVDRKAMIWLVRQPGTTLAERAGPRQRIRAVAREESEDTPENRVLHSYARLAWAVARDYERRHRARAPARVQAVAALGRQCRQLVLDLAQAGVGEARTDAVPNFVLQSNPDYRRTWDGWRELLQRERLLDELWRWQSRSWEEFCMLAVVVALWSVEGARVVATSPLLFRQEQAQGRWIEHVNPLAVFHLPAQDLIVEVQYGRGDILGGFGAAIWLRFGVLDHSDILTRWAIWPVWHPEGGLEPPTSRRCGRCSRPDTPIGCSAA